MTGHKSCLAVSEDRLFVDLVSSAWKCLGLELTPCAEVSKAFELVIARAFDLVLIDSEVAGAWEFVMRPFLKSIPIIVLIQHSFQAPDPVAENITVFPKSGPLGELMVIVGTTLGVELKKDFERSVGIIVADDEDAVRNLLIKFLQSRGYLVAGAPNGKRAVELARRGTFSIALIDISMPEMGGLEVLSELARQRIRIGAIVLTGVADSEIAKRALQLGAFDYVLKPFNPGAIESSISACLSHLQYRARPWWKAAHTG